MVISRNFLKVFLLSFLLFCGLFFSGNSYSQNVFSQVENLDLYSSEKDIINGELWVYQKKYVGHPFWEDSKWLKGTVTFNGKVHDNLLLKYNIVLDELILFQNLNGKGVTLKLNRQKLDKFTLIDPNSGNTVRFEKVKLPGVDGERFYNQVYNGKSSFYIFHHKITNNKVSGRYTGEYLYKPILYLKVGDVFEKFTSKSSFLQLLNSRKIEVKKYIRENKIKLNRKNPSNIGNVLKYFDSLNQAS